PEAQRSPEVQQLLGKIPYLNGGIFERHQIEKQHGETIRIADRAFKRLFAFFDEYHWHLDDRPLRNDREINPDVLGYIFEKYINQKQMGAYYTKEDITEYISQNTILPFLFDEAQKKCRVAFEGEHSIWTLLVADPEHYIYPAVRKGAALPLPAEIAAGLDDVSQRSAWNSPTPPDHALPTEIWRETVERRRRYEAQRDKLAAGEVISINDLITYNLDIRQFAQDVIEGSEGPELIRAFWRALQRVTVLDPTCGSGAFLFAALNILQPLYEACLDRMAALVADLKPDDSPLKYKDFKELLAQVATHPNEDYFILKSIVVNNLYGVDIMPEAVEIAKLRLFLKLVAQVERDDRKPNMGVEPLPDIDFNIRAGNTLVGFATREEVQRALTTQRVAGDVHQAKMLVFDEDEETMRRIEEKAGDIDRLFVLFREMQSKHDMDSGEFAATKRALRQRLGEMEEELNRYLAREYSVDPANKAAFEMWLKSHQPFHWFVEFFGILQQGGFDVIIGNPPYVEYRLVRKTYILPPNLYKSELVANLYAFCMERSCMLIDSEGWFGMIVPTGVLGLDKASMLREVLLQTFGHNYCSTYAIRPSKLFEGVDQRLCIYMGESVVRLGKELRDICTTRHQMWSSGERPTLFEEMEYHSSFLYERLKRIPQIGTFQAEKIIEKLEIYNGKLINEYYSTESTGYLMHYHR
ncbi:MAG: SAM-dependent methyltransferase, partial [Ardenticatenales bacterium]|nr:SAM-dependent methyltransferase [Ardenticatenales bacterium]